MALRGARCSWRAATRTVEKLVTSLNEWTIDKKLASGTWLVAFFKDGCEGSKELLPQVTESIVAFFVTRFEI